MTTTAQRRIKTYIGFAIKSRNIVYGADMTLMGKKRQYLILFADSINRTSKSRLLSYCESKNIPILTLEEKIMEEYVNKINCKCVAITDKNLAEAIINAIGEGGAANE